MLGLWHNCIALIIIDRYLTWQLVKVIAIAILKLQKILYTSASLHVSWQKDCEDIMARSSTSRARGIL